MRSAKLTLGQDGSLEGEILESYTGHTAIGRRADFEGESASRQAESVKEDLLKTFPQAEVAQIEVLNAADAEKPLEIRYRIRIPGYAQRTGRRMIFQPLYFQRGDSPRFTAGERKYDVHFRHAWKEADSVIMTLPEGYQLDNAENPGGLDFGRPGSYKLEMSVNPEGRLVCNRELIFGKEGVLLFPQKAYPLIKRGFDELHRRDTTALSIRRAGQ